MHLTAGAHRVLIGAPSPDADFDLVFGVNEGDFDPGRHHVVSNASCTTNSLAPVLKILLDHCGLPFEEQCLRYYEKDRAVRTASSEQVRQPIYKDAVEQWKNYEDFLQPLRKVLEDRQVLGV